MSYTVLARKYRPQRFEDMLGQEHVTRSLKNAIRMHRVHHAFLFTGVRGVGKTTAARILAKTLCCLHPVGEEPCNECPSCVGITRGNSQDVLEIDGASNTGVDDVRQLRETIHYAPTMGAYRVYIIDEVHMLTTNAFNALLKTLEEPPPHVKFIFATTEAHKLPATILSRVQRYDFRKLTVMELLGHLTAITQSEGLSLDESSLLLIAREGAGSVRDALSLLDQVLAFDSAPGAEQVRTVLGVVDRSQMMELGRAVINGDVAGALGSFRELSRFGYDLRHFITEVADLLRNILVVATVKDPRSVLDVTADEARQLTELAGMADRDRLTRMFTIVTTGAEQVLRSPFPHLVLEVLIVRLCDSRPLLGVGDLLERLDDLGSSRASGSAAPPTTRYAQQQPPQRPSWQSSPPSASSAPNRPGAASHQATPPPPASAGDSPRPVAAPTAGGLHTTASIAAGADAAGRPIWKDYVTMVAAQSPLLSAKLRFAVPLAFHSSLIEITFPSEHRNTFADADTPENLALLEKAAQRYFNSPLVKVRLLPPGSVSREPAASPASSKRSAGDSDDDEGRPASLSIEGGPWWEKSLVPGGGAATVPLTMATGDPATNPPPKLSDESTEEEMMSYIPDEDEAGVDPTFNGADNDDDAGATAKSLAQIAQEQIQQRRWAQEREILQRPDVVLLKELFGPVKMSLHFKGDLPRSPHRS